MENRENSPTIQEMQRMKAEVEQRIERELITFWLATNLIVNDVRIDYIKDGATGKLVDYLVQLEVRL